MITIRFNIRVFVKNDTNKVAVRVRWNSKQNEVTFITGMYAEHSKWDSDTQKARKGTMHNVRGMTFSASEINATISTFLQEIKDVFDAYALQNSIPTTAELKSQVNDAMGRGDETVDVQPFQTKNLQELFDEFLRVVGRERNWTNINKEKYVQAYHHFTAANPNISPRSIDLDSMFRLREWYVANEYKNRTINKQLIMLSNFLKWIGQQEGYCIPNEVLKFKSNLKVVKNTVTFLYFEELARFSNFTFANNDGRLAHARDLWCFMAYTSLRYSDLKNLKTGHIVNNRIEMVTQKTSEHIHIPLTDGAIAILEKYKGKETADGHVFNVPSDQKLNTYVKEAAKIVGLDRVIMNTYFVGNKRWETQSKFHEIISCHDGRRTFISCSLAMGIPPEVVMKCTGHNDYNAMKPYIEIASATQDREMQKWNRNQLRSQILTQIDNLSEAQLQKLLLITAEMTSIAV